MWAPCWACVHAKLLQSCLTLCNPMDCSPPGSSVHEILQARIQEGVAMPSSRESSRPWDHSHLLQLLHCRWILYCRNPGHPAMITTNSTEEWFSAHVLSQLLEFSWKARTWEIECTLGCLWILEPELHRVKPWLDTSSYMPLNRSWNFSGPQFPYLSSGGLLRGLSMKLQCVICCRSSLCESHCMLSVHDIFIENKKKRETACVRGGHRRGFVGEISRGDFNCFFGASEMGDSLRGQFWSQHLRDPQGVRNADSQGPTLKNTDPESAS